MAKSPNNAFLKTYPIVKQRMTVYYFSNPSPQASEVVSYQHILSVRAVPISFFSPGLNPRMADIVVPGA